MSRAFAKRECHEGHDGGNSIDNTIGSSDSEANYAGIGYHPRDHGFEALVFSTGRMLPVWERLFLLAVGRGWAGVILFFVLSGFLITGILLDSVSKPRYYFRFYSRRALRILPAYYLLIVVLLLVSRLSFVTYHTSWAFAGLSVVYLSNVSPLLGVARDYQPFWSLAVEEHFYLIWPAAVRVLTKKSLGIVAAVICISEPILRAFAVALGGLWWGPYTWFSADGLALGALLAIFARSRWSSRKNLLRLSALSALGCAVGSVASSAAPAFLAIALKATCINYGALSILGFALWLGTGPYRRVVNLQVLSFYGFISYGLYLIHMLIIHLYVDASAMFFPYLNPVRSFKNSLIQLVVTLVIATGIAYLSRTTFEEFFLQMKGRLDRRRDPQELRTQLERVLPS